MAKNDAKKTAERVEYEVLKPVFVNGSLCDPNAPVPAGGERRNGKVYVMAEPGLQGKALRRTGGKDEPPPPPQGDGGQPPPPPQGDGGPPK